MPPKRNDLDPRAHNFECPLGVADRGVSRATEGRVETVRDLVRRKAVAEIVLYAGRSARSPAARRSHASGSAPTLGSVWRGSA